MGKCRRACGGLITQIAALGLSAISAAAACEENAVHLKGAWGHARFNVEIADDPAERAQGLMHREHLPATAGMVFLYDQPHHAYFWMRNTLIPLDILFIDQKGRVTKIHENAIPLDETSIDGGPGVSAVLEIQGGMARRIGIVPGSVMQHRHFGVSAAWPC